MKLSKHLAAAKAELTAALKRAENKPVTHEFVQEFHTLTQKYLPLFRLALPDMYRELENFASGEIPKSFSPTIEMSGYLGTLERTSDISSTQIAHYFHSIFVDLFDLERSHPYY